MILGQRLINKFCAGFLVLILSACESKTDSTLMDQPQLQLDSTSIIIGQTNEDGRTESFLGIPFAEPPVGEFRWAPPRSMNSLNGSHYADEFAPACMQGDRITQWYKNVVVEFGGDPQVIKTPALSEDCLYLNIWRSVKNGDSQDTLPVIVYIHGGSNKAGWSYEPNYIGHNLAKKGVIVISVAYRLGVFGFFSHPEFKHSNFGLLDLVEALRWINRNIATIGGDPARITVMGESAGASNLDYLMAIPASSGLFSRAIHQSSGSSMLNKSTKADHSTLGLEFASTLVVGQEKDIKRQLRKISAKQVLETADEVYKDHYFDIAVDGQSVHEPLMDSLKSKSLHAIELLIGSNKDESLMYLDNDINVDSWLDSEVDKSDVADVKILLKNGLTVREQLNILSTAKSFLCPSLTLAKGLSNMQGRSWFYYFTRQREGEMAASMGAYHGAELPYIFDTHDDWLPTAEADRSLTEVLQNYWVNFASTGNPNQVDLPHWPAFSQESPNVLSIGDTLLASKHPSEPLCAFLSPTLN